MTKHLKDEIEIKSQLLLYQTTLGNKISPAIWLSHQSVQRGKECVRKTQRIICLIPFDNIGLCQPLFCIACLFLVIHSRSACSAHMSGKWAGYWIQIPKHPFLTSSFKRAWMKRINWSVVDSSFLVLDKPVLTIHKYGWASRWNRGASICFLCSSKMTVTNDWKSGFSRVMLRPQVPCPPNLHYPIANSVATRNQQPA